MIHDTKPTDVITRGIFLFLLSLSQHQSKAAPVTSRPRDLFNHSLDPLSRVHSQFTSTIHQLRNHYDSHPGLRQFETYRRRSREAVLTDCQITNLGHQGPLLNHTSSLLCPYDFVCKQFNDSQTYPSVIYEAQCRSELSPQDRRFHCKEVTYNVPVMRNLPCGDGRTEWKRDTIALKTACVAYETQLQQDRIEQILKVIHEEKD